MVATTTEATVTTGEMVVVVEGVVTGAEGEEGRTKAVATAATAAEAGASSFTAGADWAVCCPKQQIRLVVRQACWAVVAA